MQNHKVCYSGIWHFYADGRPFLWRLFPGHNKSDKPLLIFCHGFKGFMDWGGFPALMQQFSDQGFHVLQFNFSLNGTTPEHPDSFADLGAFRRNTLSREVLELLQVCSIIQQGAIPGLQFDGIILGGHSRGGYVAGAAAAKVSNIKGIFTWAGVVNMRQRLLRYDHEKWAADGCIAELNARTGQTMEMGYSLWQDFDKDEHLLFGEADFMPPDIPLLMVHGTADQAVDISESRMLCKSRNQIHTFLLEIPGADHTFGMKHPMASNELPRDAGLALKASLDFVKRC